MTLRPARRMLSVATAVAVTVALAVSGAGPAAARACPTEQGARTQVAALVAQLHDLSGSERSDVRRALVTSLHTERGAHADTPDERAALGQAISALARTLRDENSRTGIVFYTLDSDACVQARAIGVDACVTKDSAPSMLIDAIRGAAQVASAPPVQ